MPPESRPSIFKSQFQAPPQAKSLVDVNIETTVRPRIIGPDDHPINPPMWLRALAMLAKTPWVARQILKGTAGVSGWLTVKLGAAGLHSEAFVSGCASVFCGVAEIIISWLCKAGNVAAPKREIDLLQDTQDDELTRLPFVDPNPTLTNIPTLRMQDAATGAAIQQAQHLSLAEAMQSPDVVKPFKVRWNRPGQRWRSERFASRAAADAKVKALEVSLPAGSFYELTGPGVD